MKNSVAIGGLIAIAPYPLIFLMQMMFASHLDVETMGQFAAVNFLIMLFLTITNWHGDKYLISKEKITGSQVSSVVAAEMIFAVTAYTVFLVFFTEEFETYTGLTVSLPFLVALAFVFTYPPLIRSKALLERKLDFYGAHTPALLANILAAIVGAFFLFSGAGLWSVIAWRIAIYICEIGILNAKNPIRMSRNLNLKDLVGPVKFSLPLFLGALLSFASVTSDIWIVKNVLSTYELGLYWFAYAMSHTGLALRLVINKLLLPILAAKPSRQSKIDIFTNINFALQAVFSFVFILLMYLGEDLLKYFVGDKWLPAFPVFTVLCVSVFVKIISGTANPLLHSEGRTFIDLDSAVFNCVILVPLVAAGTLLYGIHGTAIAVLISSCIMAFYIYVKYVRIISQRSIFTFYIFLFLNLAICLCFRYFFVSDQASNIVICASNIASFFILFLVYRKLSLKS